MVASRRSVTPPGFPAQGLQSKREVQILDADKRLVKTADGVEVDFTKPKQPGRDAPKRDERRHDKQRTDDAQ